jgi:type II restriction enzyme
MALTADQQREISDLLKQQIRRKLTDYNPETNNMPFHIRLLGRDRMAIFSFVQSINTTLGTSVFEQVAVIIAKPYFKIAISQYKDFNNTISENSHQAIQNIIDNLKGAIVEPNKPFETREILKISQTGIIKKIKKPRIDLFLETHDGDEYYIDLKTVKANRGEIIGFKRTLLEWVAIRGAQDPACKIHTELAIPYNPYEPNPYDRWTFKGMFDIKNELKVADEFWNFLGGSNTYNDLLNVFEQVGLQLKPEIDEKFKSFNH